MQVLLVSAQEAHLSRLMLNKLADAEQQRRFHRLAFGLRASKKSQEEVMDAAREFLEISGIQQLEERVLSFLFSHSGILKMLATLDDSTRMLHQVRALQAGPLRCQDNAVSGLLIHVLLAQARPARCHSLSLL